MSLAVEPELAGEVLAAEHSETYAIPRTETFFGNFASAAALREALREVGRPARRELRDAEKQNASDA
jgi:hypothetical protein